MRATTDRHNQIIKSVQGKPELETWENQIGIRLSELDRLARLLGPGPLGHLLELGCGNGIGSAYFSSRATQVVATDLGEIDPGSHSIGLERAKQVFRILGVKNATVRACSAESLPFKNKTFDTVFSLHCLEHVPDRNKALKECLRVLRPGGRAAMIVPATACSLVYPLGFYAELFRRTAKRLSKKQKKTGVTKSTSRGKTKSTEPVVKDWKTFRKHYPHFPLPQPHGVFPSYFHELVLQNPVSWQNLFKQAGFERVEAHAISIVPSGLMSSLLGETGWRLYQRLYSFDERLCDLPNSSWAAQILCIIGTKSEAIDNGKD